MDECWRLIQLLTCNIVNVIHWQDSDNFTSAFHFISFSRLSFDWDVFCVAMKCKIVRILSMDNISNLLLIYELTWCRHHAHQEYKGHKQNGENPHICCVLGNCDFCFDFCCVLFRRRSWASVQLHSTSH